jgi:hypothetical protein
MAGTSKTVYVAAAAAVAAATTAISEWFKRTSSDNDPWEDREIFNNRMQELQSYAGALQTGLVTCKQFMSNAAQVAAWRGVRDGFSSFYGTVGTLTVFSPNTAQVAQAKSYASKLYFWGGEYARLKCGTSLVSTTTTDPYTPTDPAHPAGPTLPTDWAGIAKWSAIGIGGAFLLKTLKDLFASK